MLLIREVLHCRPGKVSAMRDRFKTLSGVMQRLGLRPFRLFTDVSGVRFWTLVAETEVPSVNEVLALEQRVMADEEVQAAMAGYHELVESGRREVYRVEE